MDEMMKPNRNRQWQKIFDLTVLCCASVNNFSLQWKIHYEWKVTVRDYREVLSWMKDSLCSCEKFIASRTELQVKISTGHVKLQVYKHISVLCTSKNKSANLTSLYQDLDYTCKLIPKSKPIFQKISSEIFEFKKISQRATIFALIFRHFLGTPENGCRLMPTHFNWCQGTREGQIGPFLGVSGPFSAIFQPFQPFFSRFSP